MESSIRIELGGNAYIVSYEVDVDHGDDVTPGATSIGIYRVCIEDEGCVVEIDYDTLERYAPELLEYFREQIGMKHAKY